MTHLSRCLSLKSKWVGTVFLILGAGFLTLPSTISVPVWTPVPVTGGDPTNNIQADLFFTKLKAWGTTIRDLWLPNRQDPGAAPIVMAQTTSCESARSNVICVIAADQSPTQTPTRTATPTNTILPTHTPTNTIQPTYTSTNTPLPTSTPTNTAVPTATSTNTIIPSSTPTSTVVPTATTLPTHTPTNTLQPTYTSTNTPLPTSTPTNTAVPTATSTNTIIPSSTPTVTFAPTATATLSTPGPDLPNRVFLPIINCSTSNLNGLISDSTPNAVTIWIARLVEGFRQLLR